jgi:aminoglycoside 2'-N-acetyltransferase I
MPPQLTFQVIRGTALSEQELSEIIALCSRAYEADYMPFYRTFSAPTHLLARFEGTPISHALWVTRWLQPAGLPLLRTAYVEAVATEPAYRGRGFATALMRRLADEIQGGYELGGLSPADRGLYFALGWQLWRGPLFVRTTEGLVPTPGERAMILRLSKTPPLDLDAPLSVEWREGEVW